MLSRKARRIALHLLLALALVLPGIAAPAQAIASLQAVAAAATTPHATGDGMPCGDMPTPAAHHHSMPDGCVTHDCSLAACIGTACLPELPRLVAQVAVAATPTPWRQPMHPRRLIDPILRPPIA
jgi:hypothetical protein